MKPGVVEILLAREYSVRDRSPGHSFRCVTLQPAMASRIHTHQD